MDEKRKKSLIRYIAVMFVVAFLLVLVSLVGQTRSIGQLSESSASALQRAQDLQDENRRLTEERDALQKENESLIKQCEQLRVKVQIAGNDDADAQSVADAYESLLAGKTEQVNTELLGPEGLETYENLTKEGENND